jgi:3-keto-5-aminohexanoate cleavage enzyme
MSSSLPPLVIEAAISPFRSDTPVEHLAGVIREAKATLAAGAGIVHHHHDSRLDTPEAIEAMIDFGTQVLDEYPGAAVPRHLERPYRNRALGPFWCRSPRRACSVWLR